jgi:hypothetical protein
MKVSAVNDKSLVIQCEFFTASSKPLPKPILIEFGYLFFLILTIYLSGFNIIEFLLKIELSIIDYWQKHLLNSIVYGSTFTIFLVTAIDSIFFKRVIIRRDKTYQIDEDSCILPHPGYNYHQNMIDFDENFVDRIDSIEIEDINNVKLRVSSYYDADIGGFPSSTETTYKVVIKFSSGESATIESNSLEVSRCDDNQIAFRELIASTKLAVEQIQSFLIASKQEITQSSN